MTTDLQCCLDKYIIHIEMFNSNEDCQNNECTKVQNPCGNLHSKWPHLQLLDLVGIIFSHFGHFFIGPGSDSTFPLTINNNAIIKAVTGRLHITFKSLHVHFLQFILSLHISYKFSSFTHLQPTIRGQKQPMEDLHCLTEIIVKREIRNLQTRSTLWKTRHVELKPWTVRLINDF